MQAPIRRAILIGSQSLNGKFLPGVDNDLSAMKAFLKSPNGGVWRDHEILTLNNPTQQKVLTTIQTTVADYLFIYFSGHGFTRNQKNRMICLTDGNLCDTELLNISPRQLVVIDACRTPEKGAAIGAISWPEEKWLYATGFSAARAYFDQCIDESPYGKTIVHATSDNNYAYDTVAGGQFTLALLDSVFNYQQTLQSGFLTIETVVRYAADLLKYRYVYQIPCIYSNGYLKVPFGIVSPEFIPAPERRKPEVASENNSANGVLICGLVLALIVIENG